MVVRQTLRGGGRSALNGVETRAFCRACPNVAQCGGSPCFRCVSIARRILSSGSFRSTPRPEANAIFSLLRVDHEVPTNADSGGLRHVSPRGECACPGIRGGHASANDRARGGYHAPGQVPAGAHGHADHVRRRGTAVHECYLSGGGGHRSARKLTKTTDCADRGLVCSEETGRARCVFEEARCAGRAQGAALCVGNVLATCEEGASHPLPDVDCSGDGVAKFCVESEQTARCSPFPESCSEDAADRCEFDRVVSCVDQIWSFSGRGCFGACSANGAMQCFETQDDLGRPMAVVATCKGEPGIWQVVGPVCQEGCACEEEQTACRCQEWPEGFQPL